MNLHRVCALIERDMRKCFRKRLHLVAGMFFPLVGVFTWGYAFGGNLRGLNLAVVDQDHSLESRRVSEMFTGIAAGPATFRIIKYESLKKASDDLRAGFLKGIVQIPYDFSHRSYRHDSPRMALIEDNTDQISSSALLERVQQMVDELNAPAVASKIDPQIHLNVVEIYPYTGYAKYLFAGLVTSVIFGAGLSGGAITFIDEKARGLHEAYLITPIRGSEIVIGFICAGVLRALIFGMSVAIFGGLIIGIPLLLEPVQLFYCALVLTAAAIATMSLIFVIVVRVDDPLFPRTCMGVLSSLLLFSSGAVSPVEGLPSWLRWFSLVNPYTYAVHALRNLTLRNTGFVGIYSDLLTLGALSVLPIVGSLALFKRQL